MKKITSADNPRFKGLLRLMQSARERRNAGLSLLDGVHLVSAYREHVGPPEEVAVAASALDNPEIAGLLSALGSAPVIVLADGLFGQLSTVASPTGIVAAVRTPRALTAPARLETCVMLEDIQDPGNLGSILRTAAAAGVRQVFLSPHSVHCWSPRVLRAGMGAHFALGIYEQADLSALAARFPGTVVATDARARRSIYDLDLAGPVAFVLGNEGAGLSPALAGAAHVTASIPIARGVESLNVAAAAAVALFERVRQRRGVSRSGG